MPVMEQKELKPTAEAEALYRRWIAHLNEEFTRSVAPARRSEVVRDELFQIYLGHPHSGKLTTNLNSELASFVVGAGFDPENVTLESEYLDGIDMEKFAPRKPLIWFWRMFDRSPLGINHWLGVRVRCMLAHHIFASVGKGVKFGHGIEFSFGYNTTIGDNCRIGRNVYFDDRSPLSIPAGTKVAPNERFPR